MIFAAELYNTQTRVYDKQHESLTLRKNHTANQRHCNKVATLRLADEETTFQAYHKRERVHLEVEHYAIEEEDQAVESQLKSLAIQRKMLENKGIFYVDKKKRAVQKDLRERTRLKQSGQAKQSSYEDQSKNQNNHQMKIEDL